MSIRITIAHDKDASTVLPQLVTAGLQEGRALDGIGLVTGVAPVSLLPALERVEGVACIEQALGF